MVEGRLGRTRLEELLAEHPQLTLQTTFDLKGSDHIARLRMIAGQDTADKPERLEGRATNYGYLQSISAAATLIAMAVTLNASSMIAWLITFACSIGFFGSFTLRLKLLNRAKVIRRLRETHGGWEFTQPIQHSWYMAAKDDETILWLITQWLLAELEIGEIEHRVREGVDARKHLSPQDPLRARMQIEIDTLRDRRDAMRTSAEAEAKRIAEHAHDYHDAKKHEQLKEQRRAAIASAEAASARDLDQKMLSAEKVEQARLEKQERAQEWLYNEPDQ